MRKLLWALFATAAAVPAMASAQDNDGREMRNPRLENRGGERVRPQNPDRIGNDARPDRPQREERAPGADGPGRPEMRESRPQPPAVVVDSRGEARIRRGDNGGRNWNGGNGRNWTGSRPDAPAADTAPPQQRGWNSDNNGRRDWTGGNNGRRDWDRNNDGRPDWNGRGNDRRDRDRRDWDRNNDGRPDWNRNGNDRRDWDRNNDGRRDWNGNNGWRGNDRNVRNWDRTWRNNGRYDWRRYRSYNRNAFRLPRYVAPYNWHYGYRRLSIGASLFTGLFARDYWISDPWAYRLPPVYWPYQWVRYYDDALLVDTRSGYVVDVIEGIFWY